MGLAFPARTYEHWALTYHIGIKDTLFTRFASGSSPGSSLSSCLTDGDWGTAQAGVFRFNIVYSDNE